MIKTKESVIKTIDRKENMKSSLKPTSIHEKVNKPNKKNEDTPNPNEQAIDKVTNTQKVTAIESTRRTKNYIVSKRKKKQQKQINIINGNDVVADTVPSTPNIKTKDKEISKQSALNNNNKRSIIKTKKTVIPTPQSNSSYAVKAKTYSMLKHKRNVEKTSKDVGYMRSSVNATKNVVVKSFHGIRKVATSMSNLMSAGIGLLLLLTISLFIGVFASLSDDATINSATEPLSQEVIEYRDTITKYAKQYDMEEYVSLIQAVMMHESKGLGNDPMQSSEFEYNTKYPKKKDGITNAEYSIDVGVHYLSDCFKLAEVKEPYDMKNISLALQGYDYGKEYIEWAIKYFDGYTKANAKVYSDEKKAELQVSTFGDPNYVNHVLQYYHLGNGDIVMVAKSQVGNVGGKPYWSWYGFNERVEWCACFVSWCANESGQLNITVPKFAAVSDGIQWYKERNQWKTSSYIPSSGDLIFFDWEQDGKSDHVGIVEKVENGKVYTIEGNSIKDECREKTYSLSSNVIFGYSSV